MSVFQGQRCVCVLEMPPQGFQTLKAPNSPPSFQGWWGFQCEMCVQGEHGTSQPWSVGMVSAKTTCRKLLLRKKWSF